MGQPPEQKAVFKTWTGARIEYSQAGPGSNFDFETDCAELATLDPTGQLHICVNRWKCAR